MIFILFVYSFNYLQIRALYCLNNLFSLFYKNYFCKSKIIISLHRNNTQSCKQLI